MPYVPDIADVVELRTWATDTTYSVSSLKADLEAALSVPDEAEQYAREIFEELSRRAQLLGAAYPFDFTGTTIIPNARKTDSSYLFCLGLTWFKAINSELRTREFENIVLAAAEQYFGGPAIRIGAPWQSAKYKTYEDLLTAVTELIPDIGVPLRKKAPQGGDSGWDIVVVKNFKDKLFSRIIALGNCATGKTNWLSKGRETSIALFWSYFSIAPQAYNVCITFFAVPFLMSNEDKLRKADATCITFDRMRICGNSPAASNKVMSWLDGKKREAIALPLI